MWIKCKKSSLAVTVDSNRQARLTHCFIRGNTANGKYARSETELVLKNFQNYPK